MNQDEAKKVLTESIKEKGQFGYSIMIEIKGEYLVKNNLVEAWSILRKQSIKDISAPGYSDYITLLQAKHLGLLDI